LIRSLRLRVLFGVVVGLLFAVALGAASLPRDYSLVARGVQTAGTVTAVEPQNHQTFRYTYKVNDEVYEGSGRGGNGNPGLDHLRVGDHVQIRYQRQ
jgi:hypothetical protein